MIAIMGIKGGLIFQDAISDMKQFAHGSDHNLHLVRTSFGHPLIQILNHWIMSHGHNGRHIETAPQLRTPLFGYPGFLVN